MRNWKRNYNDDNSARDSQIVRKKTRWKVFAGEILDGTHIHLKVFIFLLTLIVSDIDGASPQYMSSTKCSLQDDGPLYKCSVSAGDDLTISHSMILDISSNQSLKSRHAKSRKVSVDVACEDIGLPSRFNVTEILDYLPLLESLSLTGCNFSKEGFFGTISPYLTSLNLSRNNLESLPEQLFTKRNDEIRLKSIDLTNNPNLTVLPKSLLNLTSVQSLKIGNNSFGCLWVATNLYPWFQRNESIILDSEELGCKSFKPPALTIYGALKAKHDEKTECEKVDKRCHCQIYVLQKTDKLQRENYPVSSICHGENVSVTLNVTCSARNLTDLPRISPLTRVLNVSHNSIISLEKLTTPEYANLGTLGAEHNLIENIEVLQSTHFVKQFNALGLNNNRIKHISTRVMEVLFSTEIKGHGLISLEENYIECTCDTYYVKLLLAKHHKKIHDTKHIYCRNLDNVMVQRLEFDKVCPSEGENNLRWYVIIAIEIILIVVVLLKVWHDSRQYRQTGILPWCSAKMPRLPCDFMLEGIKERPNGRQSQ